MEAPKKIEKLKSKQGAEIYTGIFEYIKPDQVEIINKLNEVIERLNELK